LAEWRTSKIRGKLWAIWEPCVDLRRCSLSLVADINFDQGFRFQTLIASSVCRRRLCTLQSVLGVRIHGFAWIRGEPWPRRRIGLNKNPHMKLLVIFTFKFADNSRYWENGKRTTSFKVKKGNLRNRRNGG